MRCSGRLNKTGNTMFYVNLITYGYDLCIEIEIYSFINNPRYMMAQSCSYIQLPCLL